MNDSTTRPAECQAVLNDTSTTGHKRDWQGKKVANEILACAYDTLDPAKAIRLRQCSTLLTFAEYGDGTKRLVGMNSCRVRLCPICSWRRSLKCFHNTRKIMQKVDESGNYGYIFLTLTLKNCRACDLSATLDGIFDGWNRFSQVKRVKQAVKGFYRGLEITHDTDEYLTRERIAINPGYYRRRGLRAGDRNPNFDTYHPHIHCVFVVNKSYFRSRYYISRNDYADLWRQSLRVDYTPQVDVRKVNGDFLAAVAEISKYATKSTDYIVPDDWDLTLSAVRTLDHALAHRRLVAYGGVMRKAFKDLRLEDAESGNLVEVGEETATDSNEYKLVNYFWHTGYRQYFSAGDNF